MLTDCRIPSHELEVLKLEKMARVFLHNCDLDPKYRNAWLLSPIVHPSTRVIESTVEFSRCRLRGAHWGDILGNVVCLPFPARKDTLRAGLRPG